MLFLLLFQLSDTVCYRSCMSFSLESFLFIEHSEMRKNVQLNMEKDGRSIAKLSHTDSSLILSKDFSFIFELAKFFTLFKKLHL